MFNFSMSPKENDLVLFQLVSPGQTLERFFINIHDSGSLRMSFLCVSQFSSIFIEAELNAKDSYKFKEILFETY